ncbi:hypothetical protein NPA07_04450 [Mycoplasmopsis caviae]|uniref:Uncharacterized protein n=1 Tax=Mycoplasmopsis caviae TaxID=55603 RepID=A0A3P8KC20_9BACT|nr:hypothetical protein [Mycoplasmopsis caviae]UUD35029.1 hypothetical protein NPA07_04450 [Mycoplasmopsis caviae]VDR42144.1 Uncharacterised protein [Mycoplasmopsis caviae]
MINNISQERYTYKSLYSKISNIDDWNEYYEYDSSKACNVVQGNVEIRRYFHEDRFAIKIFFIQPYKLHKKFFDSVRIEINGKPVKSEILEAATDTTWARDKIARDYLSIDKWTKKYKEKESMIGTIVLSPKFIDLPYEKFRNLRIFWNSKKSDAEKQLWEINRIPEERREYTFNAKDNKVTFMIPQLYEFDFNGYGWKEENSSTINYMRTDITLNEFDKFKRKNELANIETTEVVKSSINEGVIYTYDRTHHWYGLSQSDYKKESKSIRDFKRKWDSFYSSIGLDNFSIKSIHNELFNKIKNEVYTKTITKPEDVTNHKDYKTVTYDNFIDYDYNNPGLVQSTKTLTPGVFIPYNHKGEFKTNYLFAFNDKAMTPGSKPIILNINNYQFVKQKLLDPSEGLIEYKYSDSSEKFVQDMNYKFNYEKIEQFLKTKDISSIFVLDKYKVTNE